MTIWRIRWRLHDGRGGGEQACVVQLHGMGVRAGRQLKLSPVVRKQLTEVLFGYIGLCDEEAARLGIEWMRDRYSARGEAPRL